MKKYLISKRQVEGFRDVEGTLKVMEKAAASHIHFLRKQVNVLSAYKDGIKTQLARLLEFKEAASHPLLQRRLSGERALLVVAGDKGIVGDLYHNLINQLLPRRGRYRNIWALGGKAKEYLAEEGIGAEPFSYGKTPDLPELEEIKKISAEFFVRFQKEGLGSIDILYPKFISVAEHRPVFVQFLPFIFRNETQKRGAGSYREISGEREGWPIFEPSKKQILDSLLRKYIDVFFMEIILEAKLSEFSARTVAAEHAVSKTKDIIQTLQLAFLKERKSSITQKQLESFIAHKTL